MAEASNSMLESHPMQGGDGDFSYSKNSSLQRRALTAVKEVIKDAISHSLDLTEFPSAPTAFKIVDLGCSVGPNTFFAVQNIIEAVRSKYHDGSSSTLLPLPEFQVFFNDHTSNDFNTLFTSLPSDLQYYAYGVPGSFHGRLFPSSSLHFVHSSYALQWLSKVPRSVLDRESPAWNKGRVHYTNAAEEVGKAYEVQFREDLKVFLNARSIEMMRGGLMVLVMPGIRDGEKHSEFKSGFMLDLLGSSLADMVMKGKISEDKLHSFNFPLYASSPSTMTECVEANGCFAVERLDLTETGIATTPETTAMHLRAGSEIITNHFGGEIIDELFDRYLKKAKENESLLCAKGKEACQLIVILKRK